MSLRFVRVFQIFSLLMCLYIIRVDIKECYQGTCDGYVCVCEHGWRGTHCNTDVLECEELNGGCAHVCVETPGSFQCECDEGYEIVEDSVSCAGNE